MPDTFNANLPATVGHPQLEVQLLDLHVQPLPINVPETNYKAIGQESQGMMIPYITKQRDMCRQS